MRDSELMPDTASWRAVRLLETMSQDVADMKHTINNLAITVALTWSAGVVMIVLIVMFH